MLEVSGKLRIPLRELKFTFSRSSGPGGQNVNKVNTKATLHWAIAHSPSVPETLRKRLLERLKHRITQEGEIVVVSQRFRDQGRNVADCLAKLRTMLVEASRSAKVRKPTRPTRASREQRLDQKRRTSQRKQRRRPPELE